MFSWLMAETSSRPLGLARMLIGTAAAVRAIVAIPVLTSLADDTTLKAPYFDWFPEPNIPLVIGLVAVWFLSAVLLAIGRYATASGSVLVLAIAFNLALDQQAYSNHLYLMGWLVLLLVIADSGAGLAWRSADRPVVRWPIFLLKAQASIVYAFAAFTKFSAEFFSGNVLGGVVYGGVVEYPQGLRTQTVFVALSIATVFVELFIAVFLWSRRFRPAAFVFGLALHVPIVLLMPDTWELIVFAIELLALYPLFLGSEELTVFWDDECGSCRDWIKRFQRSDLFRLLRPLGKAESRLVARHQIERSLHLRHHGETTRGFRAITRILEHLVPTLWLAPLLLLPGVAALGERWYRWQARRRACAVGIPG